MLCPACRTAVSDDTTICEHCNAVVDPRFLDKGPSRSEGARAAAAAVAAPDYDDEPRRPGMLSAPAATSEAMDSFLRDLKLLAPSEKLTALGVGLALLSLALPWRDTRGDDVIGFLAGAWPLVAGALLFGVGGGLFLRRSEHGLPYRELILQASILAAAVACLVCLTFLRLNYEVRYLGVGTEPMVELQPRLGAYLALFSAALATAGAALSWFRRDSLPG